MKNKLTKYLALILFAAVVFSCNVKEKFVQPELEIAENYNNTTEVDSSSFSDLDWWELFNDTVLTALIEEGLNNNILVQNMAMSIKQSQLQYEIAQTMLRPSVNYGGSTTASANSAVTGVIDGSIAAAANVSYTLDLWGRLSNQRDAAFEGYLATEIAYHQVKATLVTQIATLYFTLRDLDNKIIVAENMIENMTYFRDIINARYKGGFVSKVDVNQADIRLKNSEITLESLIRARGQLENAMSIVLGSAPKTIARGLPLEKQLFPDEIPVGVPIYLLQRRPDVIISEKKLMAQLRIIDATQALKYPNLTLSLDVGAQISNPSLIFTELAANLVGPIFNSGRINKSINIEEEEYNILVNNYIQSYLIALQEVEDAIIAIDSYEKEFTLKKNQLELSQEALDLAWVRYNEGITTFLEFLNLQASLFNAQLQASESYKQYLESIVKLYLALGGGWEYEEYIEPE
ncbi:MAG: efflux transporter outer membrane subunit [Bacteroidota bacterium]